MFKKTFIMVIVISLCLCFQSASAEVNYVFVSKKDTSYANVKRGVIRIIIPNDIIPTELQLRNISMNAWNKYKGRWKIGVVFSYIKDMPTNGMAYGIANFKYRKLKDFSINTSALDLSDYLKKKNKLPSPNQNTIIKSDDLIINKRYVLSKKTPLMPSPNPKDVIKALKKSFSLKPNVIIQIVSKKQLGSSLWYEVFVYSSNKKFIGHGWINDASLLGQKIKP